MPTDQGHTDELTIDGLAGEVTMSIPLSVGTHGSVSDQLMLIYQLNENRKI